jgi:hypothetical protein
MGGEETIALPSVGRIVHPAARQRTPGEHQLVHLVMQLGVIHYQE